MSLSLSKPKLNLSASLCIFFLVVFGCLFSSFEAHSQCVPRTNFYWGEIIPDCDTFATSNNVGPGTYFRVPVTAGVSYSISTCNSTFDTQLTGFEGTIINASIFYNDDSGPLCGGNTASITYTPNFTNYMRVSVTQYNCLPGGSTSAIVQVRENSIPAPTVQASSNCIYNNPTLSVTNPDSIYDYFWQTNPNGTSVADTGLSFQPASVGTYYVRPRSPINPQGGGGCWSPASTPIVIGGVTSSTLIDTSCDSYVWALNGQTYDSSGIYYDTIMNSFGCDSFARLDLTLKSSSMDSVSEAACDSFTWQLNGMTYDSSGVYRAILTNAEDCDSVVYLNLTITDSDGADASFTYSVSGTTVTFTNTSTGATSYLWSFGDGNISLMTDPVHTYAAPSSSYEVILSASNGCGFDSDTTTILVSSIEGQLNAFEVKVYPNPSNGLFYLDLSDLPFEELSISVFDVNCSEVYQTTSLANSSEPMQLDLSDLPKGTYMIYLSDGEHEGIKRILLH